MTRPPVFGAGQHFGTTSRQRRIGRFMLTETTYAPAFRSPWHAHEPPAFCLVLRGTYVEQFRDLRVDCRPSTVVFRPPAVDHADRVSLQGAACFIVEPDVEWWVDMRLDRYRSGLPFGEAAGNAAWLLWQTFEEFRHPDSASPLIVEGLLLALTARLTRASESGVRGRCPAWLRGTRELLDVRLAEPISLDRLGAEAGVHPVHLATAFRRAFGCTVGAYVRQRRIETARMLLSTTRNPLAQIALELGFSSQSHFTRVFRRYAGTTPNQYRRLTARS